MTKTVLLTGGTTSIAAGLTRYLAIGNAGNNVHATEITRQIKFRQAGVLNNLYVHVVTNGATAATTVRTRKTAANGAQSVSIGSGATGLFQDTVNSDTVALNNLLNYQVVVGTGGTIVFKGIGTTFTPTTTTLTYIPMVATSPSLGFIADSTSRFECISGEINTTIGTPEARVQTDMPMAGTFKGFSMYIATNARSSATTCRLRKNSVNATLLISINSSTTGLLEDLVNSDAVVIGNEVNYVVLTNSGTGSNSLVTEYIKVDFEVAASSATMWIVGASAGFSQAAATTNYVSPAGSILLPSTTEASKTLNVRETMTFTKFGVNVTDNTATFAITCRVRKNTADGNGVISASAAQTGFLEDATNSDVFTATDNMAYSIVGASGTGTATIRNFHIVTTFGAPPPVTCTVTGKTVITRQMIHG